MTASAVELKETFALGRVIGKGCRVSPQNECSS